MSYVRVAYVPGLDRYNVAEVQMREDCTFIANLRHGPCTRYQRAARWEATLMQDGRLVHWLHAALEGSGAIDEEALAPSRYVIVAHGRLSKGFGPRPGVASGTHCAK